MQIIPVRITVPENSLQSFLTIANPIPLLAPVTYQVNSTNYYTGVCIHAEQHVLSTKMHPQWNSDLLSKKSINFAFVSCEEDRH